MKIKVAHKTQTQTERRRGTQRQMAALQKRISDAIQADVEEFARIAIEGDVAVLALAPTKEAGDAARAAGWDGTSPSSWRMSEAVRKRLIKNSDTVTAAWLSGVRPNHARIFVFMEGGTLLVNFVPTKGFYFEPASLDSEMA